MIVSDERMVVGVAQALAHHCVAVPRHMSVIGITETNHFPESLYPALTAVRLPLWQLGSSAVGTLISVLRHGLQQPVTNAVVGFQLCALRTVATG